MEKIMKITVFSHISIIE